MRKTETDNLSAATLFYHQPVNVTGRLCPPGLRFDRMFRNESAKHPVFL